MVGPGLRAVRVPGRVVARAVQASDPRCGPGPVRGRRPPPTLPRAGALEWWAKRSPPGRQTWPLDPVRASLTIPAPVPPASPARRRCPLLLPHPGIRASSHMAICPPSQARTQVGLHMDVRRCLAGTAARRWPEDGDRDRTSMSRCFMSCPFPRTSWAAFCCFVSILVIFVALSTPVPFCGLFSARIISSRATSMARATSQAPWSSQNPGSHAGRGAADQTESRDIIPTRPPTPGAHIWFGLLARGGGQPATAAGLWGGTWDWLCPPQAARLRVLLAPFASRWGQEAFPRLLLQNLTVSWAVKGGKGAAGSPPPKDHHYDLFFLWKH